MFDLIKTLKENGFHEAASKINNSYPSYYSNQQMEVIWNKYKERMFYIHELNVFIEVSKKGISLNG